MLQVRDFELGLGGPILDGDACALLAQGFPAEPNIVRHSLCDHPLFSLDILARAALQMNPEHVERRKSANSRGFEFDHVGINDVAGTIRNIDQAGRWVMLRFAEQLPEYAQLLQTVLAEMEPVIGQSGQPLSPHAFIFISSPGTRTPMHFDPEFNILFQIAGRKRFATYPADAPWLDAAKQASYHRNGDNLLPWVPAYAEAAMIHALRPGDALFVPYKSPHWVEVDDEPSVSLSLTWSCETALELEAAWQLHGWLGDRQIALKPPPPFPGRAPVRAGLWRGLGKMGLV